MLHYWPDTKNFQKEPSKNNLFIFLFFHRYQKLMSLKWPLLIYFYLWKYSMKIIFCFEKWNETKNKFIKNNFIQRFSTLFTPKWIQDKESRKPFNFSFFPPFFPDGICHYLWNDYMTIIKSVSWHEPWTLSFSSSLLAPKWVKIIFKVVFILMFVCLFLWMYGHTPYTRFLPRPALKESNYQC